MDQDAEATNCYVRAIPGRVFARLARITDTGAMLRGMHVEFTPAQALYMARQLEECARIAIGTDCPTPLTPNDINNLTRVAPTTEKPFFN